MMIMILSVPTTHSTLLNLAVFVSDPSAVLRGYTLNRISSTVYVSQENTNHEVAFDDFQMHDGKSNPET